MYGNDMPVFLLLAAHIIRLVAFYQHYVVLREINHSRNCKIPQSIDIAALHKTHKNYAKILAGKHNI